MANKNLLSKKLAAVGVVLVMAFVAGCSSNKNADSGNTAGGDTGSSTSGAYDPNASGKGSGSDAYAQNGRTIYFGFNESTLNSDSQSTLDNNIAKLKSGSQQVRVEGHADERGTREYNLALGERRANIVVQYLVANGIAKSRLETISYGKERPADAGHDEAAWAKNRRVELVY